MRAEQQSTAVSTSHPIKTFTLTSDPYVLDLREIDATRVALAGGKGAHLGALSHLEGIRVPPGFCVTTEAFRRVVTQAPSIDGALDRLSCLDADDRSAIRAFSAAIRRTLQDVAVPGEVTAAITLALARAGERSAYAVRSSATAEDSPTASFAGQHDTYLNIVGPAAILEHVRRAWASLFTERAVTYRIRHGLDHRTTRMAVVVQRMAVPQAAGVLFTADPVTSNRRVVSVEAAFGLGEAVVCGLVDSDIYKVRDGAVVAREIGAKRLAVHAGAAGGTEERAIEAGRRAQPALTDAQALRLAALGRRIEAHFGRPQDIEWCLTGDDDIEIVQSRPITTLFPVPDAGDDARRVYVSVGHGQMMTDAMRPLGISLYQHVALPTMYEAGGRLFVDVAPRLASPATRPGVLEALGRSDPLVGDALRTIVERGGLLPPAPEDDRPAGAAAGGAPVPIATDPAVVDELIRTSRASVAALGRDIRTMSGPALLDFILADIQELRRITFDSRSTQVITAGMEAAWWLDERLEAWLGEKGAADTLALSVPRNITSEMGLALLDVADVVRPHPEVMAFLDGVEDDAFLDGLDELDGGREAREAIEGYLERYGMRCVGEIDITRPRWGERPSALVPMILGNARNAEAGAGRRRFEQGRRQAWEKEQDVLERLRALPGGADKAREAKRMIDRVRTFSGYREDPKYCIVSRFYVYKQALMGEAGRLAAAGVLREPEDVFYLTLPELGDVLRTHAADHGRIAERRQAFAAHQALTPPRVMTSEGEVVTGAYRRDDVPAGALAGLPVSAGTVEGRARVILDLGEAELEPGDILVTTGTDPSWSPLFVAITGLVTEVGGLMTHGTVIAREYGLPAVVGVEDATRRIRDGQRIRVHGTGGYVELLA
ncbi:phosphoenolpyruvate synthase [Baekduia soli]|uniref:Rifampicin phosphotransferase n=1 Tax=Baekduia soli TaxID=496014 RepID=A0A5B8TZM1_9ACTN|nr:rifamycin-inactivating phosphotransferase [Baekduia soli]QEC46165.1 phosphoenolpyruvate synthase [Baekduia soli]